MARALVFFTMCIISCSHLGNAERFETPIDAPKCICPHGSKYAQYCGSELKELNNNARTKVLQTACQDQFVYWCKRPNQISRIAENCQYSCVKPTQEFQAKYTEFAGWRVAPDLRWCINLSQSGKCKHIVYSYFKNIKIKIKNDESFTIRFTIWDKASRDGDRY